MPRHSETRYLPYTPEQLFELVADVEHYDDFLPWVVAVRVRSSSERETIADLVVGFNAFKERFTSRVVKERPTRICVDYVEGPLKYLHNEWTFDRAPDGGSNVHFSVDFAFKSRLFESLAGAMFDRALRRMINAFEQRAAALYGVGHAGAPSSVLTARG
ncbi:MAG: type II toxin-antitoxin system RatA family toxin [Sphingomicrobium sp.]